MKNLGFTMIELLIVIAILGILAVAVLSAINPVEQIQRGRDTGRLSDAEQLISAIERHNAFSGWNPWNSSSGDLPGIGWTRADLDWFDTQTNGDCEVLYKLSVGNASASDDCDPTYELKEAFIEKISDATYRGLFVFNAGGIADSTYICFLPESGAFAQKADERCEVPGELPSGYPPIATVCPGTPGDNYYCVP